MVRDSADEFIEFIISSGALQFGDFTLKSGRKSPYFLNFGILSSGFELRQLGAFLASAYISGGFAARLLCGLAYKGIPMATVTAIHLSDLPSHHDLGCIFTRKEAKLHGEGGSLTGNFQRGDSCVIVDDVLTAGTAIRAAMPLLSAHGVKVEGVLLAVDRQEASSTDPSLSAAGWIEQSLGVPVASVSRFTDLLAWLQRERPQEQRLIEQMQEYRECYGVASVSGRG